MNAISSHEVTMWLGTRQRFCKSDTDWDAFIEFVGLSHLSEVRSIDSSLNHCSEGDFPINSMSDLWSKLESLRPALSDMEYHLLFVDADRHDVLIHPRLSFLGYDLADETWTSSLLNCGRWKGPLASLAAGSRSNGLLELQAARIAQAVLPEEWSDDPHGNVTIWALYEVCCVSRNV